MFIMFLVPIFLHINITTNLSSYVAIIRFVPMYTYSMYTHTYTYWTMANPLVF